MENRRGDEVQTGSITGGHGRPIPVAIHAPPAGITGETPAVVILHGFKGFASWGFFPYLAARLAEAGFAAVRVNFSHNGVEELDEEFTRLDLFEQNTFLTEVADTEAVCEAIRSGELLPSDHSTRRSIALLGHSRGGGIALLGAAGREDIDAVVTWAAVSTFDRYTERQLEQWREEGVLEAKNSRTGQTMRLGRKMLEELENHPENLDIVDAVRRLDVPLLIVHGEVDLSVSIENAERLFEAADGSSVELEKVPKAGHTFGAAHPFAQSAPALERAVDRSISFLSEHLL